MEQVIVTCDNCLKVLNPPDNTTSVYSLRLSGECHLDHNRIPCLIFKPLLYAPHDFCGFRCLQIWLEKNEYPELS